MNIELTALIEELTDPNSKKYSHSVFGCFTDRGHTLQETRGLSKRINENHYSEKEADIFDKNKSYSKEKPSKEFEARVWAEKIENEFRFRLIFDDYQGDNRYGSHTDYTLLIPESEIQRIKPVIEANPQILIKVFQKVFPNYDRSNGKLRMREDNVYFEYNDPAQINRFRAIIRWK